MSMLTSQCRTITLIIFLCGSVLLGGLAEAKNAKDDTSVLLTKKLQSLKSNSSIEVKMGTNKEIYNIGDVVEMRFQVSNECYLSILHVSANGDMTFLVPNAEHPDVKIEPDTVYSTLQHFDLGMTAAEPKGVEALNIFCIAQQFDLFDADFEKEAYYSITKNDEKRLQNLLTRLDQLKDYEWSGNSQKIGIGYRTRGGPIGAIPPIGTTGTSGKWFPPIGTTGTVGHSESP